MEHLISKTTKGFYPLDGSPCNLFIFTHSYDAIGLSGLCWMSALVSALAYGFVLELVPDVREASDDENRHICDNSCVPVLLSRNTGVAGGHRDAVRGHGAVQEVQLEGRGRGTVG